MNKWERAGMWLLGGTFAAAIAGIAAVVAQIIKENR